MELTMPYRIPSPFTHQKIGRRGACLLIFGFVPAMIGAEALSYAVHFFLLGSMVASLASLVTCTRALLSLVTRSRRVAVAILCVNLVLGLVTVRSAVGCLPVLATSAGTVAFFWFGGLPLRLILLGCTACWLANNLVVGSIGGTMLELFVGAANISTCYRLWRGQALPAAATHPLVHGAARDAEHDQLLDGG
jgi:hypothetical protein